MCSKARYPLKEYAAAAIKVMRNCGNNSAEREGMEAFLAEMNNEACVMSALAHDNVIDFYGICTDKGPMILMEFCVGGSLDSHLQRAKEGISTSERMNYLLEIAEGMRYLDKNQCVHRDLATRNVLISSTGQLKIADFGLSLIPTVASLKDNTTHTQIPIRWMAPESLTRNPVYSTKTDVWSYGVLIFEVFNLGVKPWPEANVKWIATRIRRVQMPVPPKRMPRMTRELMIQCWGASPDQRPTFKQLSGRIRMIQESRFPVPDADKFTLNQIKGVTRENDDFDDEECLLINLDNMPEVVEPPLVPPESVSMIKTCGVSKMKPSAMLASTVQKPSLVKRGSTTRRRSLVRRDSKSPSSPLNNVKGSEMAAELNQMNTKDGEEEKGEE